VPAGHLQRVASVNGDLHELLARAEVAAAFETRPRRGGRDPRPSQLLWIRVAGQGPRDQTLAGGQVVAYQDCRNRTVAQRGLRRLEELDSMWLRAIASATCGARDDAQTES
jgi:hypothetical protein